MKKTVIFVLCVLLVLMMSACNELLGTGNQGNDAGEVATGPAVNTNTLSEGGLTEGTYTQSIKAEKLDMELTLSSDSATFVQRNYDDPNAFVNITYVYTHNGTYELDKNGNVAFTFDESYYQVEYIGTEENIAEYVAHRIETEQSYLEQGQITQEEYDEIVAQINGEKIVEEWLQDVKMTARLDISNGKFYMIDYSTGEGREKERQELAYHSTGSIHSITVKKGNESVVFQYDLYGYPMVDEVEREYYDNGVVKSEYYPKGWNQHLTGEAEKYFYNEAGLLIAKESTGTWSSRIEYEYDSNNIRVFERHYTYDAERKLDSYGENTYYSYSKARKKVYNVTDYTLEEKRIYKDYETWNGKKTKIYHDYLEEGYSEITLNKDEQYVSFVHYDRSGRLIEKGTYDENKNINYRECYDENGNIKAIEEYDASRGGTVTKEYDENGEVSGYKIHISDPSTETYTDTFYDENWTISSQSIFNNKTRTTNDIYYDSNGIKEEEYEYSYDESWTNCNYLKYTVYNKDGTIKYYVIPDENSDSWEGQYYDANGNPISEEDIES